MMAVLLHHKKGVAACSTIKKNNGFLAWGCFFFTTLLLPVTCTPAKIQYNKRVVFDSFLCMIVDDERANKLALLHSLTTVKQTDRDRRKLCSFEKRRLCNG